MTSQIEQSIENYQPYFIFLPHFNLAWIRLANSYDSCKYTIKLIGINVLPFYSVELDRSCQHLISVVVHFDATGVVNFLFQILHVDLSLKYFQVELDSFEKVADIIVK